MAQHDYVIANGTGAAVRSDLNGSLAAIVSNNSGATEPGTMYAYQWWADTTTGLLKLRNSANSAWISLRELDGTLTVEDGTAAAPGLAFTSDLNTGLFRVGADQLAISTGGTSRLAVSTTAVSSTLAVDVPLGAVATPSLTFTGDLNTGIYSPGADQVAISTGGTARLNADTAAVTSTLPVVHPLGAVGTPSITFTGDLNTGIWSPAADTIAFSEGGAEAMRIDSSSRLLVGTSSTSATCNTLLQATGGTGGTLILSRNAATPADGEDLGFISFNDSAHIYNNAVIRAQRDGGTWTATTSKPTRLVFSTTADGASSPTERMRINSAGTILIKATSSVSGNSHQVDAVSSSPSDFGWFVRHPATDGAVRGLAINCPNYNGDDGYLIIGSRSGGDRFYVKTSGNVQNSNNSYGAISDLKLKQDIELAGSQWSDIKLLSVKKFRFKNEPSSPLLLGLIAQDVEQICPGLIEESGDFDAEGNSLGTVTKGVKYSVLYMKAVKALQEAMARIEQLEQRLTDAGIA